MPTRSSGPSGRSLILRRPLPIRKTGPPILSMASSLPICEKNGLQPAPPAGKTTLLRRATFDLTGLPPTEKEINDFLADKSPNAFEKVVDRLLASPRYGERWGRQWLDVMRYADSTGSDEDHRYPHAWRYRDYVIQALMTTCLTTSSSANNWRATFSRRIRTPAWVPRYRCHGLSRPGDQSARPEGSSAQAL